MLARTAAGAAISCPALTYASAALRRHPGVSAVLVLIAATIVVNATVQHDLGRALIYLAVVGTSVVWIDLVLARWPVTAIAGSVRGAGFEVVVLAASFVAGLAWLYARFVLNFQPPPGPLRLIWLGVLIGCAFNALPAVFLLARRYGLRDLGLGGAGLQAVPLVMATFAAAALLLSPATTTWRGAIAETGGSFAALVGVALSAAVPEEFFRFVWQTRVGAWRHNAAVGWLVASLLWAALHAPKDWSESHSLASTITGVVDIVPLGLLWGYLTHRSRSMLPSIVLHATNLWGLQNLA